MWRERLQRLRGELTAERNLAPYEAVRVRIAERGRPLGGLPDEALAAAVTFARRRALGGEPLEALLPEVFALVREAAERAVHLRAFDEQVLAGVVMHQGKLAEMQTGEGKTLAAVFPAVLDALTGQGVHVLGFNDYLAERDAAWMGPIYRLLGVRVAAIRQGMTAAERRAAYAADVTYVTAKEAGFDFLRMHLCTAPEEIAHRPFHSAIVDEADSILIDEARVPLVIAGDAPAGAPSPRRIAEIVSRLEPGADFQTDDAGRNVHLTDRGIDRVQAALGGSELYGAESYAVLLEVNQALHARALLRRDVDYIVRGERIELVDELTGRVVDRRRWPDGLQAALEAKEGLPIQSSGHILGTITMQHFLERYPKLCGMTATAEPAVEELAAFYGLSVVVLPTHQPCARVDRPDVVFTHADAKRHALVAEITRCRAVGRPVLVGTASVRESEGLAEVLAAAGVPCEVLNARNDAEEAAIVARAGAPGAVTISTNMAGRGTDIRLGRSGEEERAKVVALGGLYVIGTNRHESKRIDDQLRGRAGRQGDPGESVFFVSLEDELMVRFGIDALVPPRLRPPPQDEPIEHPLLRRQIARLQRIVEGQNLEVRKTLRRYSELVEAQRELLHERRIAVVRREMPLALCAARSPERHRMLCARLGVPAALDAERRITLFHIDRAWAEHLAWLADVRESIHLVSIGGQRPLDEFHKAAVGAFDTLLAAIDERIVRTFEEAPIGEGGLDIDAAGVRSPSSTWTYLVNDEGLMALEGALAGSGNFAIAGAAALGLGPILFLWALFARLSPRKR